MSQVKKNHPEKLCHLLYDQLHVGGSVFVFNEALGQVVQLQDESRFHANIIEIIQEKKVCSTKVWCLKSWNFGQSQNCFTEVFPQLLYEGRESGIIYRIFQTQDIINECRSCEIGMNRANSQSGPIQMHKVDQSGSPSHSLVMGTLTRIQLTLRFCKKVLAAVQGEVVAVQRTS